VLIKRRDVRLRERRIGPYKYPAVNKKKRKGGTKRRKQRKKPRQRERQQNNNKEERTHGKKKPKTEGGETKKRRRRRAFSSRCPDCYLRIHLRQVKSSSFSLCCISVYKKIVRR